MKENDTDLLIISLNMFKHTLFPISVLILQEKIKHKNNSFVRLFNSFNFALKFYFKRKFILFGSKSLNKSNICFIFSFLLVARI